MVVNQIVMLKDCLIVKKAFLTIDIHCD